MSEKQELNTEEMGRAAGGWEFRTEGKYHTWLNGYEIKCPHCGNASADVAKKIAATTPDGISARIIQIVKTTHILNVSQARSSGILNPLNATFIQLSLLSSAARSWSRELP